MAGPNSVAVRHPTAEQVSQVVWSSSTSSGGIRSPEVASGQRAGAISGGGLKEASRHHSSKMFLISLNVNEINKLSSVVYKYSTNSFLVIHLEKSHVKKSSTFSTDC